MDNGRDGGMAGFGGGNDTGVGFGESSSMGSMAGLGRSAKVTSSSSVLPSTGNQQYLELGNPFQDQELLESMCCQWQQLPNWNLQ